MSIAANVPASVSDRHQRCPVREAPSPLISCAAGAVRSAPVARGVDGTGDR